MTKRKTEFVLIERGEGYGTTAVTWEVFDDMVAAGDIIVSHRPVTKAEIKKGRIHIYYAEHYFKHKAYAEFEKKFKGKVFKAKVTWFRGDGGYVEGLNGEGKWWLWACNISGKKTWFPETACVYHEVGTIIDAEVIPSFGNSLLVCHTPGTLDTEKWNKIKDQGLPFQCDDDGKAITGIFA